MAFQQQQQQQQSASENEPLPGHWRPPARRTAIYDRDARKCELRYQRYYRGDTAVIEDEVDGVSQARASIITSGIVYVLNENY